MFKTTVSKSKVHKDISASHSPESDVRDTNLVRKHKKGAKIIASLHAL